MAVVDTIEVGGRELPPEEYGYFLGHPVRPQVDQPLYSPYDQALRIVGPMGSGKTFRFMGRVMRNAPGGCVATGTKPDTVELTYGARVKRGPTCSLDPQGIVPGIEPLRWPPVWGAWDTEVAELRASGFVAGSAGRGGRSDEGASFYRRQATTVLACLLHAAALDGASFRDVLRWASRFDDPAPRAILDHHPGAGPGWADRLADAITGDERTVGNTRSTLSGSLACFAHQAVLDTVDVDPDRATDVEALLDARGTIYLLGKDSPYSSVSPLVTAVTEDILDRAERMAYAKPARRLDPPVLVALDEAPNIAPLPSLRQRVADGRGRGLCVMYAAQSWAGAEARFGKATADELAAMTNNTLVLGGDKDPDFHAKLEKLCGLVRVFRTSASSTQRGGTGNGSRQVSEDWQPVFRAHEVQRLSIERGEALLLAGDLPPVITQLPKLSDGEDWPQIEAEIRQVRDMADAARARADAERRRFYESNAAAWRSGGRAESEGR
ncbi:type IV secretory system conjugative DNA transfer family protein [Kitasatospora sp. NBC_01302]|uniref:type IV secretory system conjugative DNA transfer family protein n=1 Tax=Kitasatospora sp. NBC_01302 TaxID=2903575 RepID=UPI002E120075|nr:TraM recognition domain-containing protein [Kitasatospora sp. NBC_01302]